jgi:hypothetical protein
VFGIRQIVFPVGERREGCMIGAVFEPSRKLEKLSSWQMRRGMVTKEFEFLVEHKRSKVKGQEKTWEQR